MALKFVNEDTGALKMAVFCFTGKSPKTRTDMESIALKAGASITKSITSKTTILVIADAGSMSTKARKARDNGIDLISPQQFFEMCTSPIGTGHISIEKPKPTEKTRHSLIRRVEL